MITLRKVALLPTQVGLAPTWNRYLISRLFKTVTASQSETQNIVKPTSTANGIIDGDVEYAAPIKPFEDIPGPKENGIIYAMKTYMPVIGKYTVLTRFKQHEDLYKKYGSIVREPALMNVKLVHLFDPKDIETIFRSEGKFPIRPGSLTMEYFRNNHPEIYQNAGVIFSQGQTWYDLRKKLQNPMLKLKSVETYCGSMDQVAKEFVDGIQDLLNENQEIPNFLHNLYAWALESIGLVVFNDRLGCLQTNLAHDSEIRQVVAAVQDSFEALNELETGLPSWIFSRLPSYRKLTDAQLLITRVAAKYIEKTLENLKALSQENMEESSGMPLLVKLLSTSSKDEGSLKDIVLMANDILMAGVDTTSHTVGMVLYNLAKNPEVLNKLEQEIKEVLGSAPDSAITPACLQQFRYLKACVKESLRASPITDGNGRIMEKDTILQNYCIPANTIVLIHSRLLGKTHFTKSEEFLPERWLRRRNGPEVHEATPGEQEFQLPHPFAFLPFGHGTRMCLGRRFAEQEIYLLLARLIQRYRVDYKYGDIEMLSRFVNVPDKPIQLKFTKRSL